MALRDDLTTVGIWAAVGGVLGAVVGVVFGTAGESDDSAAPVEPVVKIPDVHNSPSPAARQALLDANARWPGRNKASDGIMGDWRHQLSKSDHNVGNAVDITHDPASGCTGDAISSMAITDPRVTYVIWNRQIWHDGSWHPYSGDNPHTHHCHISIRDRDRSDARRWPWA